VIVVIIVPEGGAVGVTETGRRFGTNLAKITPERGAVRVTETGRRLGTKRTKFTKFTKKNSSLWSR
jgi:hypothetical protein